MSTVSVTGLVDDKEVTYEMGKPLPPDLKAAWDAAIERNYKVGLQWWREVPSYTEPAGFVAAAVSSLDEVKEVQGFDIPQPEPGVNY